MAFDKRPDKGFETKKINNPSNSVKDISIPGPYLMVGNKLSFQLDHFFGFRVPLLPYREWQKWSENLTSAADAGGTDNFGRAYYQDRQVLRERLRAMVTRSDILEALQVASPDLVESLPRWLNEPDSEKGQRLEAALVRYFARMCHRPTPFGLFAGHGMGRMGSRTHLQVPPRECLQRRSRLDMGYLCELVGELRKNMELRDHLEYRPNTSLYRVGSLYRHSHVEVVNGRSRLHLVEIQPDDALETALARAKDGASLADLVDSLVDDDLPTAEVRRYLNELIDKQILVSNLEPNTTGQEFLPQLVTLLQRSASSTVAASALNRAERTLQVLDARGIGNPPEAYQELSRTLEALPVRITPSKLWQVDLFFPEAGITLGPEVQQDLILAASLLERLMPMSSFDPFAAFKEGFERRYDQRWVPLAEALDPEYGVGWTGANGNVPLSTPLLDGLLLDGLAPGPEELPGLQPREVHLLKRVLDLRFLGKTHLELGDQDLAAMEITHPGYPMPHSFACQVELYKALSRAQDPGDHLILIHGAWGPSAARMLGRFCHGDPGLAAAVCRHLREEERMQPHAVFAEVAHLPEGRMGNVMVRPVLRAFEIPFLGRSGAPAAQWICVEDLYVGLREGRVVLWSRRLNREVVPRLSSAAAYHDRGSDMYRFLACLQDQGVKRGLGFSWGNLAGEAALPRVTRGKLVLARAQWRLSPDEMATLRKAPGTKDRFLQFQNLRRERGFPRHLLLADADNELPVDLENPLAVEALWSILKSRREALLVEDLAAEGCLLANGPDGAFTHQLVVTFLARPDRPPPAPAPPVLTEPHIAYAPGSEWLFVKLYMGQHAADRLLAGAIGGWVRSQADTGAIDRWFFLRYSDPEPHLRFRFHGNPERIWNGVFPDFKRLVQPFLSSGLIWRLQLDTYEAETLRYGGHNNRERAERVFMADSETALEILSGQGGTKDPGSRWRIALASVDAYLDDAGIRLEDRILRCRAWASELGKSYELPGSPIEHRLGARFRLERRNLSLHLDGADSRKEGVLPGLGALRKRTGSIRPLLMEMSLMEGRGDLVGSLEEILPSFIHMSLNRLLSSAQRTQEWVIYLLLIRWYQSKLGQARRAAQPGSNGPVD